MLGLNAVEHAYERLWSMAYRTWQIEHRGEFWLALRRATSLPRGNKRDYVSYKTLVQWRFACGGARGFWFIDPLGLRPCGLCTRARHINRAPPSYNYNIYMLVVVLLVCTMCVDYANVRTMYNPAAVTKPRGSQPGNELTPSYPGTSKRHHTGLGCRTPTEVAGVSTATSYPGTSKRHHITCRHTYWAGLGCRTPTEVAGVSTATSYSGTSKKHHTGLGCRTPTEVAGVSTATSYSGTSKKHHITCRHTYWAGLGCRTPTEVAGVSTATSYSGTSKKHHIGLGCRTPTEVAGVSTATSYSGISKRHHITCRHTYWAGLGWAVVPPQRLQVYRQPPPTLAPVRSITLGWAVVPPQRLQVYRQPPPTLAPVRSITLLVGTHIGLGWAVVPPQRLQVYRQPSTLAPVRSQV